MLVARNNRKTAADVFRAQVIASVAQLENAYWDLAAAQRNIAVAQESLKASQELLDESRKQFEIGTMPHLDVVTAESQVAGAQRDMIIAQTALEQQDTTLKQLLSKRSDPELDAAKIEIVDPEPEPLNSDIPALNESIATALHERPEISEANTNLANQEIAIRYTRNNMLPNASIFGLYASSGLQGHTTLAQNERPPGSAGEAVEV
jgi:outer membrane protein TolC